MNKNLDIVFCACPSTKDRMNSEFYLHLAAIYRLKSGDVSVDPLYVPAGSELSRRIEDDGGRVRDLRSAHVRDAAYLKKLSADTKIKEMLAVSLTTFSKLSTRSMCCSLVAKIPTP